MIVKALITAFCILGVATAAPTAVEGEQELKLSDAVASALKNNPEVLKATHRVDAARADVAKSRGGFFPRLDLDLKAGTFHDRTPIPGDATIPTAARDRNSYIAELKLTQPIFAGFRHWFAMRGSEAKLTVEEIDLEIAKENAVKTTIEHYFGLQLLEQQLQAERETQKLRERQAQETEQRAKQGSATSLQEMQARYAVKEQAPKLLRLEADISTKGLKLYRALGLPLDQKYVLPRLPAPGTVKLPTVELPPLPEAFEFALRHSLRIRKLDARVQAMQADSGSALADHLPSLGLHLNAGTNAFQRTDIGSRESLAYGGEIRLTIPIFSGLQSVSERSIWQAKLDEIKQERAMLRETLLEELNDAYRQLEISSKRMEAAQMNLELTGRTVKAAQEFNRMGRSTLLDVLDAFTKNLEAKKQAAQDSHDRIVALFRTKALLGLGAKVE